MIDIDRLKSAYDTWYNLSYHSHGESAFLFLSNSRLSVRVPRDCGKHEKQQVGGSLIGETMKKCSTCKKHKDESCFNTSKSTSAGLQTSCRDCMSSYKKELRKDRRLAVINHYGGECACCGEAGIEFLSIDHANGGGRKHREDVLGSKTSSGFYEWLINNNYPSGFRVLCMNCNTAIGWFGYCPHKKGRL